MAAGEIFSSRFPNAKKPQTIEEVDNIIIESGQDLKVEYVHEDISTSRGSVFPIITMNIEKIFKRALVYP